MASDGDASASEGDPYAQVRRQLATLARRPKDRLAKFTRAMPCDFRPHTVTNPETGLELTEPGAWEIIADRLENGEPMKELVLDTPPGKRAYVMIFRLGPNAPHIYVKLQLASNKVICRSFHYSQR